MKVSALLTSAGINLGVVVLVFSLYSILRKQPSNAVVYFTRGLAAKSRRPKDACTIDRFLPSASWVKKAWELTENEILACGGLDAVTFYRYIIFRYSHIDLCCIYTCKHCTVLFWCTESVKQLSSFTNLDFLYWWVFFFLFWLNFLQHSDIFHCCCCLPASGASCELLWERHTSQDTSPRGDWSFYNWKCQRSITMVCASSNL